MGYSSNVSNSSYNKAKAFEAWTVKVDKNQADAQKYFTIVDEKNLTSSAYKAELKKLANDYINMIDGNGDGKISYKEFETFNINELKNNTTGISQDQIAPLLDSLKLAYQRLDVDKEGASKGNLDYKEVMNYFFAMDINNDDVKADGKIAQQEYIDTSLMLASKTQVGKDYTELLKQTFNSIFKNY